MESLVMAWVRETMPTLCYDVDPEASFSVVDGADTTVIHECLLQHPWTWELQLPADDGVLDVAEPGGNTSTAFAHDVGWATNTAGVSSSSSSSSPVTFDGRGKECPAVAWTDDDPTDQLVSYGALLAPRATPNLFISFEGGDGTDVATAAATNNKRARAAPSQHGSAQEEATTETNKKRAATTKRAQATATPPPTEPQKSAAKNRRERVNERLKVLQELVPNGRKLDTVTMLDKAITYVKFMQLQLKVLETDAFWPTQGGKAPEMSQVKEALDAILLSASSSTQCDQRLSF